MKNLNFALLIFLAFFARQGFTQNKAWILAPKYIPDIGTPTYQPSLPTPTGGYNGDPAISAQNIQMDANDQILFFIVDGKIYDRLGYLIDKIEELQPQNDDYVIAGVNSEIVIIPDMKNCEIFHLISAQDKGPYNKSKSFYAKLRIVYNAQGVASSESGLVPFSSSPGAPRAKSLHDYVGSQFSAINGDDQERAIYAAVPDFLTSTYKIFVLNGRKIFRFSITNETFSYDSYNIDVFNFCGLTTGGVSMDRGEMEAIRLSTGEIRIAIMDNNFDYPGQMGAIVLDANYGGNFTPGSHKICGYLTNLSTFPNDISTRIGGIEFSSDGNKLFITHQKFNPTNSTLDYWDLSGPTAIKHELSTLQDLSISQIELAKDGNIYIPRENYLARISSINTTPVFNATAISISPYSISSGVPGSNNKIRLLQDQIDGSNVTDNITPNTIHAITYNASTSATWNGSSPIAPGQAIINIEKELRIKAGTSITIQNMTIRFAPGARLVIENGAGAAQGGKLYLQNTVLTNFVGCGDEPDYWLGVEVWGNSNTAQNIISNTTQGLLRMSNNSRIEYAINGVLLSKRVEIDGIISPESYLSTNNGGIVITEDNATFLNCLYGIHFQPYNIGSVNVSTIGSSIFNWDEYFIQSKKPGAHVIISNCTDIRIGSSKFLQSAPLLYSDKNNWGYGIFASNSTFSVTSKCSTPPALGQDCPDQNVVPSEFTNLRTGIFVWNLNNKPFTVLRNKFENCINGINSQNAKNQVVSRNTFKIHEDNNIQTWGIFISNGDKYKVEENKLSSVNGIVANNYGIIIDNSGELDNEVYKNTFSSLLIGTQAQRNNGKTYVLGNDDLSSGLRYNCNVFTAPINIADIAVASNSKIDYNQGRQGGLTLEAARNMNTARNSFSYTGSGAHDILLGTGTHQITYYHLGDANHAPLTYTNTTLTPFYPIHQSHPYGNYLYSNSNTCLTRYPSKPKQPGFDIQLGFVGRIDSLKNKIDGGDTKNLLAKIKSAPGHALTYLALQNASPFLSDTVLTTYIHSNASNSNLKDILVTNSQLSNSVLGALSASTRPRSLINDLMLYQNNPSAQQALYREISLREEELYNYEKEFISYLYNDSTVVNKTDSLIHYLNLVKGKSFKKDLLSLYSGLSDETNFNRVLDENKDSWSEDLVYCFETIFELNKKADWKSNDLDSLTLNNLEFISQNSDDDEASDLATSILSMLNNNIPDLIALPIFTEPKKSTIVNSDNKESLKLESLSQIEMYPNPSTGVVQLVFSELETKSISVQVTDLTGKSVYDSQFENTSSENIDLTHLKKGTYLVSISIDGLKPESKLLVLE